MNNADLDAQVICPAMGGSPKGFFLRNTMVLRECLRLYATRPSWLESSRIPARARLRRRVRVWAFPPRATMPCLKSYSAASRIPLQSSGNPSPPPLATHGA